MGLQEITVGAIQRLTPKPSIRSETRADRASDDFKTFLEKARSARKPEDEAQDESVAPADEQRETNEDVDASQDAVAETSAPVVVDVPTQTSGESQSEQSNADDADATMPRPEVVTNKQADATSKPAVQEGSQSGTAQVSQQNASADADASQAASQSSQNTNANSDTNASQRQELVAAQASSNASQQQAAKDAANTPVVQKTDDTTKDNAGQRVEQSQQPKDTARPVAEQNQQTNQNDSNGGERQTQQQASQQQSDRVRNAGDVNEPSLHDQKIAASIEERRQGDAEAPRSESQPAVQVKTTDAVNARLDLMAERAAAPVEAVPTAVKVVSGDKAAEGVGRFLLETGHHNAGDAVTSTATSTNTSSSSTAAGSTPTSVSGSTFADTLAASVDSPETLSGAARTFQAGGGNGRYQVTMKIDPPDLGQIRLQVRMQNQGLTLQVDAESSSVAKLIESRLSQLRDALAAHGIRVERADVVVKSPSGTETNTHHQNQNSGQHAGTHGTGDSYGDLPGDGRHAHGSQDEPKQGADWRTDVDTDSETNARADGDDAGRGWMNRTAATELSLDLVA